MKIKKINRIENVWVEFSNPVPILTKEGIRMCVRAYVNGIRDTFVLKISDGTEMQFTDNHMLMSVDNKWTMVKDIEKGFIFNNNLFIENKEYSGKNFVLDMEVPDAHHYILENGIVSHNSSFILGQVSPSIEPLNSNYFVKNLAKGKFTYKNPYLKEALKKYDKNNDDVWKSILVKGGSVQHLDFLSKEEKDVFKTFGEISQKEIVIQAAQRQKYIDQAQSLNLMIPPNTSPKEVNSLLIEGWELGVKTFYYQRSANPAQELARSILTCSSCEA
jgi:hypothetical protein